MADALAGYQAQRDEMSRDIYEWTQSIAALDWTPEEVLGLIMNVFMKSTELAMTVETWAPAIETIQVPSTGASAVPSPARAPAS